MRNTSVVVVPTDNRYEVVIIEDGMVTRTDFDFAESAESYASGQRIRLGLPANGQAGLSAESAELL
ncbi:hypothetical protein [Neorhizobium tomejilense]|uniref:hypothetical protein n=1 Tax=Neorhizobium tomejilense TaxID=2093828 RepID=UPI000CF9EE34|nr:hypothetical protein [Neorhizobium tomejilense]